jgi:hypothetical protein
MEIFKVLFYPSHRALRPSGSTLVQARTRGEAMRLARTAAQARPGVAFWKLEG